MADGLVTRLVVDGNKIPEAIEYFKSMQADVIANEPAIVYYSFFQDKEQKNLFWVMEVFNDMKAVEFHLECNNWRMPDFEKILIEPAVFHPASTL